jgi:hypothetical protein
MLQAAKNPDRMIAIRIESFAGFRSIRLRCTIEMACNYGCNVVKISVDVLKV